jgi:hypothetical protein
MHQSVVAIVAYRKQWAEKCIQLHAVTKQAVLSVADLGSDQSKPRILVALRTILTQQLTSGLGQIVPWELTRRCRMIVVQLALGQLAVAHGADAGRRAYVVENVLPHVTPGLHD